MKTIRVRTFLAAGFLLPFGLLRAQTATTTVLIDITPPAARFGQVVTLAAQVAPASAPGTVSFLDGGVLVGSGSLNSSGIATMSTIALPAGGHAIRAVYGGASGYQPSQSPASNYSVAAVPGRGFSTQTLFGSGLPKEYVASGNFNSDGKADLVVANWNNSDSPGSVSVMLGNGDGTFQTPLTYVVGSDPSSVVVGDFNGDGRADLAVADAGDNSFSVLIGNGDGTFQAAVTYPVGGVFPLSIGIGDFNGDAKADLVVANNNPTSFSPGNVSVFLGNGDGTFRPVTLYTVGLNPTFVAVGDFNGDGTADLVVTNGNNLSSNGSVSVLLGNGDGTFQAAVNYLVGAGPDCVAIGDFNGDAVADLAVTNSGNASGVSILLGNGDGTFQAAANYAADTAPSSIAVADIDGDGKADLVVSHPQSNSVSVLLGDGDGTFQTALNYATGSFPDYLVVGDFNGDGVADLAVANFFSSNVSVLLGIGVPADFNGDGHPDVIWEDPNSGWAQIWYLNGPQGVTISNAADLSTTNPWHIVGIADFDENGSPDVVWQDPVSGAVQVWYLGGPAGNVLAGALNITAKNSWQVVSVADFNEDGHPDLLWEDPKSGWAQIWYLGGPEGITLLGAANLTKSNSWHIVGTADFNGDRFPDVVWQDPASGTVQIWYMGGTQAGAQGSQLQSALNLTGSTTAKVAAIADFNQDGHPDVVFQDPVSGAAMVYYYAGPLGTTPLGTAVLSTGNPWYIAGPH